jgi:hypothetical protein
VARKRDRALKSVRPDRRITPPADRRPPTAARRPPPADRRAPRARRMDAADFLMEFFQRDAQPLQFF